MALAKTATITRKQPKKSLKNSSWGLVTVPGRLHRVVYIAPWASAGYRGCIPWWTRSHHPGSPSSHSDRKREEADIFFFSSLNRLPPSALGLFSSATPLLWLTGLTSPQLVAVSFSAQPRLSHTLPPPLPRLTCSLPLRRSLSLLLSLRRPVPELGYILPLMFIKRPLIDYSWGGPTLWGLPKRLTSCEMKSSQLISIIRSIVQKQTEWQKGFSFHDRTNMFLSRVPEACLITVLDF